MVVVTVAITVASASEVIYLAVSILDVPNGGMISKVHVIGALVVTTETTTTI